MMLSILDNPLLYTLIIWMLGGFSGTVLTMIFYRIRNIWKQDKSKKKRNLRIEQGYIFYDPDLLFRTPHRKKVITFTHEVKR